MIGIIGIIMIFVMVFGGFLMSGGSLNVIVTALPHEMVTIGGASVGAFLLANDLTTLKQTGRDVLKVFRGPMWKPADYRDLLGLLFDLIRIGRANPVALEEHIEAPDTSPVFGRYPKIRDDHELVEMICDTMRAASMNYDDPHQVEEVLDKRMAAAREKALHTSEALQTMADSLPAIGIVAAVLGVIQTMGSIDQPPEILGEMIASALVGTFMGVFLAYGFVGPFSNRVRVVVEEDQYFYQLVREVLVANLHRHPPNICVEVGRQNTPHHVRPTFSDVEEILRGLKQKAVG